MSWNFYFLHVTLPTLLGTENNLYTPSNSCGEKLIIHVELSISKERIFENFIIFFHLGRLKGILSGCFCSSLMLMFFMLPSMFWSKMYLPTSGQLFCVLRNLQRHCQTLKSLICSFLIQNIKALSHVILYIVL